MSVAEVPELVTNSGVVNDPAFRARATRALEILAAAAERERDGGGGGGGGGQVYRDKSHGAHRQKGHGRRKGRRHKRIK